MYLSTRDLGWILFMQMSYEFAIAMKQHERVHREERKKKHDRKKKINGEVSLRRKALDANKFKRSLLGNKIITITYEQSIIILASKPRFHRIG